MMKLLLIFSSSVLHLMIAPSCFSGVAIYLLLGVILPLPLFRYYSNIAYKSSKWEKIIGFIITAITIIVIRNTFISHWLASIKLANFSSYLSSFLHIESLGDVRTFLNFLCILLIPIIIPFCIFLSLIVIKEKAHIIILIASVSFFMLFQYSFAIPGIMICLLMLEKYTIPKGTAKNRDVIISVIMGMIISFFAEEWYNSNFNSYIKAERISTFAMHIINLDANTILKILSIILSLLSLPFTIYLSSLIILCPKIKEDITNTLKLIGQQFNIKSVYKALLVVIGSCIIGFFLLLVVFSLPVANIDNNVSDSAYNLLEEGPVDPLRTWCTSGLDYFTDSIMLLISANDTQDTLINRILLAYRGGISGYTSELQILLDHYTNGVGFDCYPEYARYWHGYLVFLKPLLSVINYQNIRTINTILQISLTLAIIAILYRRKMRLQAVAYFITYLVLMPEALAFSMQYSSCFYLYNISTIGVLYCNSHKKEQIWILFLLTGVATSFFDLLTYPIITFGIPSVILVHLMKSTPSSYQLFQTVKNGIAWGGGYVGMWSLKWVIASVLTDTNVIVDAINRIGLRTYGSEFDFTIQACLTSNVNDFCRTPFIFLAVIFCILLAYRIDLYLGKHFKLNVSTLYMYIFLALIPFIWYSVALDHSSIHHWFTNKGCAVSLLSILFAFIDCYEETNNIGKHDAIDPIRTFQKVIFENNP